MNATCFWKQVAVRELPQSNWVNLGRIWSAVVWWHWFVTVTHAFKCYGIFANGSACILKYHCLPCTGLLVDFIVITLCLEQEPFLSLSLQMHWIVNISTTQWNSIQVPRTCKFGTRPTLPSVWLGVSGQRGKIWGYSGIQHLSRNNTMVAGLCKWITISSLTNLSFVCL